MVMALRITRRLHKKTDSIDAWEQKFTYKLRVLNCEWEGAHPKATTMSKIELQL
jgi:hypothetical protein